MSNAKIIGAAIGALIIGIAIGFVVPTDSGIEQTVPQSVQTAVSYTPLTLPTICSV